MEENKHPTKSSALAAREETTEGVSKLAAKEKGTLESFALESEVNPSNKESREAEKCANISTKLGASQFKGVKRKSFDDPDQGYETNRYRKKGSTSEKFAEEFEESGERGLSNDNPKRRNGENGNGGYNSRSEKRLKLKSSITSGTERSDTGGTGDKEDGQRKEDKTGKLIDLKDEVRQKSETHQERWKGNNHHGYNHGADFDKSRMTQSRRERDKEHRKSGQPSNRSRADTQHDTQGGKLGRDGNSERYGNKSRILEDSKTRDVPKRSTKEVDRVRVSARHSKGFDEDHDVIRGDKRQPRDRFDRYKHGELEEENFEGRRKKKQVISETNRKHGDGSKRHHDGKDLRQNWEAKNGHKYSHHGGGIGFTKQRADRNFKFQRLPKSNRKPRSRKEGYCKDNVGHQGHSLTNNHKQNSRGIVHRSNDYHRQDGQDSQRESHRSGRKLDHDKDMPRKHRRIEKTGTKERFSQQRRDKENGPDSVKQNSEDRKSCKENVDHHSSRGANQPGTIEIKLPGHKMDQKSGKENIENSFRSMRGTDQPGSIDIRLAGHEEDHKPNKENLDHSSKETRATDQPVSVDMRAATHEVDQKSDKENLDHPPTAMRGTNQPGSVDTKVAKHEVDQNSVKENADHPSRGVRGTEQPESMGMKMARQEVNHKSGEQNVDISSIGKRGIDQPGSADIEVATHEVNQKSGKENVDHFSRRTRGTDKPGSRDTKVAFQLRKPSGGNRKISNTKLFDLRQSLSKTVEVDVERIPDQNGGKGEEANIETNLLESRLQENITTDNPHKLQLVEAAKSVLQKEPSGPIDCPRQTTVEVDSGQNISSQDTVQQSSFNPSIPEKRKRKDRGEIPEAHEIVKLRLTNAHKREKSVIHEGNESKRVIEKQSKDDFRSEGTAKQKSSHIETDAQERMTTDSRASRKSDGAPQLSRSKVSRRKKDKTSESSLRRQVAKVDRYKHDVTSQQEHKHHKKRRGRSHSMSPHNHKHFSSPKKVRGQSTSPGRSEGHSTRSSDWEKFERKRERERRKTLAAFDSRYRRFGGGTSGLGGYSPRRRRSDAAVKTPSPPPRSPDRKKEKTWDSVPPGMDSSMIAAISAAHRAAMQNALAQLTTVNPLVAPNMVIPPIAVANRLTTVPSFQPQINPAVVAVTLTQATRPLRRLYVGNLPSTVSDGELLEFMNAAMLSANANHLPGTRPCINCTVNVEKNLAFAEFITPEDATAALAFDGVTLHGTALKLRRPKDFVDPLNGGVESVSSVPDMISNTVSDSPHKVFVGGIPSSLTADKVKEIVTAFGQLKAFHWEVDNNKQTPQAFAFLEYMDPAATMHACTGLNGMRLGTAILTVVQATPDADTTRASASAPFYGIPEQAKPLLESPSCVLELNNLVSAEEVPNMSKEDIEELIEDVRLECTRFGNVKSIHMVHHLKSNRDLDKENAPSLGNIKCTPAEVDRGEILDCTNVQDSAQEEHAEEETHEGLTAEQTKTVPAKLQLGVSFDEAEKEMGIENGPHIFRESSNEWQVNTSSTSQTEKIIPSDGHGLVHVQDENVSGCPGLVSSSGQEIDVALIEWEISHLGKVYVEFSMEESACRAAHALHGRLFDGHKVAVIYFPLKLYQKRFHKGCCPNTFQEKQALVTQGLAVQGHLTEHVKD